MATRRIQTFCTHQELLKGSRGYCHSRDYADTTFPIDMEICGKPKQVVREHQLDDKYTLQILACGHWDTVETVKAIEHKKRNLSFEKLLPFQREFVEFAERNNCQVICRDEMGLGKTYESLVLLDQNGALFTDNFKKYCVIVCLPGAIFQWNEAMDDVMSYMDPEDIKDLQLMPQTIYGTGQKLNTASKVIILPWSKLNDKKIISQIEKLGVGGLIVDECHFFKDENSARTRGLQHLIRLAGLKAPKVFLSGTLTENKVLEMNVALNAIDPVRFSSWKVLDRMCLHSREGKALSIAPYWRDRFKDMTKHFMIGRNKEQVGIPLPFNRDGKLAPQFNYEWLDVTEFEANKEFADAYNLALDQLQILLDNPSPDSGSIIGLMQQLRHHTGRMKILSAAVWIDTWMMLHPGEKLAVGVHHKAVRETLCKLLHSRKPLSMSDEDAKEKDEIETKFKQPGNNLLICSILSAGTGRNFQFCKNAVILERQWNRSKEDQFAQRFHRIIKDEEGRIRTHFTDKDMVNIFVLQAKNSFDEYFHELVDLKGIISDSTDDSVDDLPEMDFILKLASSLVSKRVKWVGI